MLLFLESENLVMHFCRKYFRTFVVLLTVYDLLASMWKIKVSDVLIFVDIQNTESENIPSFIYVDVRHHFLERSKYQKLHVDHIYKQWIIEKYIIL